jgi:hypothetical protein
VHLIFQLTFGATCPSVPIAGKTDAAVIELPIWDSSIDDVVNERKQKESCEKDGINCYNGKYGGPACFKKKKATNIVPPTRA